MRINGALTKNPTMPYQFLITDVPVIMNILLAIAGWVFTSYLGWCLARNISTRLGTWKERIFTSLLLIGLVTISVGYGVEATAIGAGWWRWTIEDFRMRGFIVGVPFIVFETWAHFPTQYLLLPYFLIECSSFKKYAWVNIFFIPPFIHSIATHVEPQFIRTSVEYTAFFVVFLLAFISPLRFDYSGISLPARRGICKTRALDFSPLLVALSLLCILSFLDLFKIGNAQLLLSLLPLLFLLLLAIERIPLAVIIILNIVFVFIFKKEALVAAVPVLVYTSMALLGFCLQKKKVCR